ncbi:copper amine oxidase N-terminal domain-containing protein [Paenibacillus sp. MWE-103]|uniref:Copper amine oxidase N-terminal domain-containing protein n=1 Tax=Paenibacillus artemisiicola TaxID=1172618 RepID=A0ABS3WL66_9BACL|nr:copper amine oxidase N-terminal domain-containing protein [Paenibacillus artemisiicola]MBO7748963.1 copper amine oxidase N-terminal domain-containing protein [Paenibacillus artemisiicola]
MKKIISCVMLAVTLLVSSTAYAATSMSIIIDGTSVASDAKPEFKDNRTMVPLRVISENLGAKVAWSKSEVTVIKDGMKIVLKTDSAVAVKNGKAVQLDVKPYAKNNRVLVPLRFIAETFGCSVDYSHSTVSVESAPLVIDGVPVKVMQNEFHMIMGGVVQQISANALNEAIYRSFETNKGAKVDAPVDYSWTINLDTPESYYKNGQYDFLDNNGKSVQRYDIYSLQQPTTTSEVLLHDVTKNQWYVFSRDARMAIDTLVERAYANGSLKVISNTVA